jgi:hypothetical protein
MARASSECATPQLSASTAGLVLLADDEPLIVRALARILRPDGHRLLTAEGLEQVDAALAEPGLLSVGTDHSNGSPRGAPRRYGSRGASARTMRSRLAVERA